MGVSVRVPRPMRWAIKEFILKKSYQPLRVPQVRQVRRIRRRRGQGLTARAWIKWIVRELLELLPSDVLPILVLLLPFAVLVEASRCNPAIVELEDIRTPVRVF